MKHVIVCLLTALLLVSCHKVKKPEKPENLIPKEKMAHIILDMSLLTAARGIDVNAIERKGILPEDFVYEKYNIDSLQFALSNNYYAYDVVTYEAIYDLVKDSLEILKTQCKTAYDEENARQRKTDSIERSALRPGITPLKKNPDNKADQLNVKD